MATATIYATKEHSIAYTSGGLNVGTSNETHAPIGEGNSGWDWKELIRFPLSASNFDGITKITSATLKIKTTSGSHCTNDSSTTVRVRGLNSSFAATGGGSSDASDSWKTNANPTWPISGIGTTGTLGSRNGNWSDLTVYSIDVLDYIEKYAPSSINKSNGTPCDGDSNYGMVLDCNAQAGKSVEFKTIRGSYTPRLVITGTVVPTPSAPTNLEPSGTVTTVPVDSDFSWEGDSSNDENPLSYWDIEMIDAGTGDTPSYSFTGTPTLVDETAGISGVDVSSPTGIVSALATAGITLTRGHWYAYKTRHENSEDENGSWSAVQTFYIAQLPDAPTWVNPTVAKPYAPIANLDEAAAWSDSGNEAKAQLSFTYTHPDETAMDDFTVNWGGVDYTKTDFGFAADKTWNDGETITIDAPVAQARGAANSVNVYITATDTLGVDSSASSTVACVVQWAQAIVQENHGSGAGNFEFTYSNPTGGSSTQVAFLFRKGDGTPGSWYSDVGSVEASTHMDILCRLATDDSTNNPQLPDFTLDYLGTGNLAPDSWEVSGTGAALVLDGNIRRFGKRSCKVQVGSAATYVSPTYGTSDPYLIVTPGETYTFSIFVLSSTALTTDCNLRFHDGNDTYLEQSTFTHSGSGDWERVSNSITVPEGVTRIKPIVRIGTTYTGQNVWLDSAQFEEGSLVTQWRPGGIGPAVSIDVGGVQVDSSKGGVFRLLSANGGCSVYTGTEGLTLKELSTGAEADLYVSGSDLQINTDLDVTGDIVATGSVTADEFVGGTPPVVNVYTSGSGNWTVPTDPAFKYAIVECTGGGGGGGGIVNPTSGKAAIGTGGGGGGYAKKLFTASDLSGASTFAYSVGTGGSNGDSSGGDATAGTASTFSGTGITTVSGGGGPRGKGDATSTSGNSTINGQGGGAASGGDVNVTGGTSPSTRIYQGVAMSSANGGNGGGPYGGGGGISYINSYGRDGGDYGGGGAAAGATGAETTGSNRVGGDGAGGIIVITEYYA